MEFTIADAHEAIAAAVPDRTCIVFRDRRFTFADTTERSRRVANALLDAGLGCHVERDRLERWESGQDHVALYLRNGNEYLEAMLGAFKARCVPFNVNYRYRADELVALLTDADARVVVYHADFASTLAEIRDRLPRLTTLVQVDDASGHDLLDGAVPYEDWLAGAGAHRPPVTCAPDDLYMAYTGGTTGLPKGVLWRSADVFVAALGGADPVTGTERTSYEELAEIAAAPGVHPYLVAAPLMHAAGHWIAWLAWAGGDPVVLPDVVDHFDADDACAVIEREGIRFMIVVGNAFGRPLLEAIDRGSHDVSSLRILSTGGAAMTADVKAAFLERLPRLRVLDTVGASETGSQARNESTAETGASTGRFRPGPGTGILSDDRRRLLGPDDPEVGWLVRRGRVPLGYLGHPERTAETFPVLDGIRCSIPGDRARWVDDGMVELLGRDSVCINTGGEKVFVEEVEAVLHGHPAVADVVVVGRPSERWGSEVCAVVALRPGATATAEDLRDHADRHLARYKLPKVIVFSDTVPRGPNGKADYSAAADLVTPA